MRGRVDETIQRICEQPLEKESRFPERTQNWFLHEVIPTPPKHFKFQRIISGLGGVGRCNENAITTISTLIVYIHDEMVWSLFGPKYINDLFEGEKTGF